MVDLQSLPLPLYLVLLVCLMPYGIVRNVWRRFIARAPISPNISPSSYTPLPSPLLSPPLSVPYTHHFVNTPNSRVHYISTAKPASTNAPSIPLLFVHGFPDFVSPTALPPFTPCHPPLSPLAHSDPSTAVPVAVV